MCDGTLKVSLHSAHITFNVSFLRLNVRERERERDLQSMAMGQVLLPIVKGGPSWTPLTQAIHEIMTSLTLRFSIHIPCFGTRSMHVSSAS